MIEPTNFAVLVDGYGDTLVLTETLDEIMTSSWKVSGSGCRRSFTVKDSSRKWLVSFRWTFRKELS